MDYRKSFIRSCSNYLYDSFEHELDFLGEHTEIILLSFVVNEQIVKVNCKMRYKVEEVDNETVNVTLTAKTTKYFAHHLNGERLEISKSAPFKKTKNIQNYLDCIEKEFIKIVLNEFLDKIDEKVGIYDNSQDLLVKSACKT